MTDITTLAIPKPLIQEAKRLKINSSDEARKAITAAIMKKKDDSANSDSTEH